MFCRKCGYENSDNANFCLKCGERLKDNGAVPINKTQSPALVVAVVCLSAVVVVALLVFLAFFVFAGTKSSQTTSVAPDSEVAEEYSSEINSQVSGESSEAAAAAASDYAPYAELVKSYISGCGSGKIVDEGLEFSCGYGLFTVRLIDFDGDGTEELYCAYSSAMHIIDQAVYGIKDGKIYTILSECSVANNGTDKSPCTYFYKKDGKIYLKSGSPSSLTGSFDTVSDGQWVSEMTYHNPSLEGEGSYTINGENVSESDFKKTMDSYENFELIRYDDLTENLKTALGATKSAERIILAGEYGAYVDENDIVASETSSDEIEVYVIPDSSKRRLTNDDLALLSTYELELARNEIYARHGVIFANADMAAYFANMPWYKGTVEESNFDEATLSEVEKYNIQYIIDYGK